MLKQFLANLLQPIIQECMENTQYINQSLMEDQFNNLAADIADNISTYDIASNIDMSYAVDPDELANRIVNELDIETEFASIHNRIDTIERKMDLILKHLGISPENA